MLIIRLNKKVVFADSISIFVRVFSHIPNYSKAWIGASLYALGLF